MGHPPVSEAVGPAARQGLRGPAERRSICLCRGVGNTCFISRDPSPCSDSNIEKHTPTGVHRFEEPVFAAPDMIDMMQPESSVHKKRWPRFIAPSVKCVDATWPRHRAWPRTRWALRARWLRLHILSGTLHEWTIHTRIHTHTYSHIYIHTS